MAMGFTRFIRCVSILGDRFHKRRARLPDIAGDLSSRLRVFSNTVVINICLNRMGDGYVVPVR